MTDLSAVNEIATESVIGTGKYFLPAIGTVTVTVISFTAVTVNIVPVFPANY